MFYLSDLNRRLLFIVAAVCAFVWVILVVVTKAGAQTAPAGVTPARTTSAATRTSMRVTPIELAVDPFTTGPRAVTDVAPTSPQMPPLPPVVAPGSRFGSAQPCMIPDVDGQCASGGSPGGAGSVALYAISPGGSEPLAAIRDRGINRYVTIGDHVSSGLIVRAITDDGLLLSNGEHVGFVRAQATAAVPLTTAPSALPTTGVQGPTEPGRGFVPLRPSGSSIAPNPAQTIDPAYLQSLQQRYPGVQFPSALTGQVQQQSGGGVQPLPQPTGYLQPVPSTNGTYLQQYGQ